MKYADIIERLSNATEPDRELDADVWYAANPDDLEIKDVDFDGRGGVKVWVAGRKLPYWVYSDEYTASIDAALALVERLLPSFDYLIGRTNGGLTIHCQLGGPVMHFGATPALAVLVSLFKALEAKERGE